MDEKISYIGRTNGSGKIELGFVYDAMGNRVEKTNYTDGGMWIESEYYVRDAQGNVMAIYKRSMRNDAMDFELNEQHLYGSARLGVDKGNVDMIAATGVSDNVSRSIKRGEKHYELSNHLGNVLATVSDKKIAVMNGANLSYYRADVVSYSDYYPFGAPMTERTAVVTPTDVRYGFNGKEVDSEINGNGNAYDFGARMYDARLGRSYSLDPKLALTPFHSGYSFFSNNPIYFIDKDGKIIEVATESSKKSFNTAIQTVFNDNDEAIAALSISEDAMAIRSISVEDYNKIMQSLNSIDQQAAFRGLYLASQSQSKYLVQVIEGNEKAFINGDAVSTEYLNKFDGVSIGKDETNSEVSDAPIFEVAISRELAGDVTNWDSNGNNVYRSESAMVLGSILTAFLHNDPSVKNDNFFRPMENIPTITQLQSENTMMSSMGLEKMSGQGFKKPNQFELTNDEKKECSQIPEQLRFTFVHYTTGVEEVKTLPAEK